MREKIRKAIQHLLSAAELWEVTTATGNSFHNLFLKTVFRILFKIWLWIYGFIIFTKYKATSLLCSQLQIKCFSSPEMSHFKKKLLQTRGTLFHLILLPPRTLEKSCLCPEPLSGFSPQCHQKLNHVFVVSGLPLQCLKRKKRPLFSFLSATTSRLCFSCHLWHNGSFHSTGMIKN